MLSQRLAGRIQPVGLIRLPEEECKQSQHSMYQSNPFLFLREEVWLERKRVLPGRLFPLILFLQRAKDIAPCAAHACTRNARDWGRERKYQETDD